VCSRRREAATLAGCNSWGPEEYHRIGKRAFERSQNIRLAASVIIDTINNEKGRRQLLRDLVNQGNSLACCPINVAVAEVYGRLQPHEEAFTRVFLSSLDLFPMTWPIAELAVS
jgi:hypothetical protein